MEYRLDKDELLEQLAGWNEFLRRKVHLVACGGTAMTLLGVKPSTKDVDFMVPNPLEHDYLIGRLKELGYKSVSASGWRRNGEIFQFDLFRENRIHTTELLNSPLEDGRHTKIFEFSRLIIAVLNDYDLISSKLMRGTNVDFDDCLELVRAHRDQIDIEKLQRHYSELVEYDVSVKRIATHMDSFLTMLKKRNIL